MQLFLHHHVDINCMDKQQRTPFMWAANVGKNVCVCSPISFLCLGANDALKLLYEQGVNPCHADKESLTGI